MTAPAPRPPTPVYDTHLNSDSLRHTRRRSPQCPTMHGEPLFSSSTIAPTTHACTALDALQDIPSAAPVRLAPRAQDQTQIVPPMRLPGPAGRISHVQRQALAKHPLLASTHNAPRYQPWRPSTRFVRPLGAFDFSQAQCGDADDNDDHYDDDDLYEDEDEDDVYVCPTRTLSLWTSPASAETDLEFEADDESSGSGSTTSSRTGSIMSVSSRTGSIASSTSSSIISLSPECALRDEPGAGQMDGGEGEGSAGRKEPSDEVGDGEREEGEDMSCLNLNLIYHPREHALRDRPRVRFLETPAAYIGTPHNFLDADDDELSPLSPLGPFALGTSDVYRYSKYDWSSQDPSSAYIHDYHTTQVYPATPDYPTTQVYFSNLDYSATRDHCTVQDRDERIYALERKPGDENDAHEPEEDRTYPPQPAADRIYAPQSEGDSIYPPRPGDDRVYPHGDDKHGYEHEAGRLADEKEKDSACTRLLRAAPLPLYHNQSTTCPSPSSSSETTVDRTPRSTPPPQEQEGARSAPVPYNKGFLTEATKTPLKGPHIAGRARELWPSLPPTGMMGELIDAAYSPRLPSLELPLEDEEDDSVLNSSTGRTSSSGETNRITFSSNQRFSEDSSTLPISNEVVPASSPSLLPGLCTCVKMAALCDTWPPRPSHTDADVEKHSGAYASWTPSSSRNMEWTLFPADDTDAELPMTPSRRRSTDLPLLSEDVFGLCAGADESGDSERSGHRRLPPSESKAVVDEPPPEREMGLGQEYERHAHEYEQGHDHEYDHDDHEQKQDINLGSPRYRSLPGADIDDDFLPRDLAPKNYVPDPTSVVRSSPVLGLGLWEAGPVASTSYGTSSGTSSGGSGLGLALPGAGASSSLAVRRRDPEFELDPRVLAALPPDAEAKRVYALRQRHRAGSLGGYAARLVVDECGGSGGPSSSSCAVYNTAWGAGAGGSWSSGSAAGGGGGIEAWEREREREGLKARELGDLLRLKLGLDERGVRVEGAGVPETMGTTTMSVSSPQTLQQPYRTSHGKPAIVSMDQLVANMVLARQADAARKKPARSRTWSPPAPSYQGTKDSAASGCTLSSSSSSHSLAPPTGNGQGADGAPLPSPPPAKPAKTPRSPLRQMLLPDDIGEYVSLGGDGNDAEDLEEGGWRNLATLVESPGALSPLCLLSGMELG